AVRPASIVGFGTAVMFAPPPVVQGRNVSPRTDLRWRVEPRRMPAADPLRWAAWIALWASVLLLIMYQAGRPWVGINVTLGIGGTRRVLWGAAHAVAAPVRPIPRSAHASPLRQALANPYRPGNHPTTV